MKFLYMLVRLGREAESVSFSKESFGDLSKIRYPVGDVVFCGGVKDFAEQGLTRVAGRR